MSPSLTDRAGQAIVSFILAMQTTSHTWIHLLVHLEGRREMSPAEVTLECFWQMEQRIASVSVLLYRSHSLASSPAC